MTKTETLRQERSHILELLDIKKKHLKECVKVIRFYRKQLAKVEARLAKKTNEVTKEQ